MSEKHTLEMSLTYPSQSKPNVNVSALDKRELLLIHTELHSYWKEFESGREVEDWDRDSLVDVHADVRSELEERDLPHQELNGLDDEGSGFELTEQQKSSIKGVVMLAQRGEFLWDEFRVVPQSDGSVLVTPSDEARERAGKRLDFPEELSVELEDMR